MQRHVKRGSRPCFLARSDGDVSDVGGHDVPQASCNVELQNATLNGYSTCLWNAFYKVRLFL